ncbi:MAG: DUF86 domain-containing protein [Parcubacteria group bacterium]|nr:DUF86 domain-containing protein [Parcubacteria group bacterium]
MVSAAKYTISAHNNYLQQFIKQLEKYQKMVDKKRFLNDEMARDAIIKALERVIEAMLTVGEMLIAENNFSKAETKDEIFEILAQEKIYPESFKEKLWGLGGFRNILVHDYVEINLELVYKNLSKGLPIFKEYSRYIAKYLIKNH